MSHVHLPALLGPWLPTDGLAPPVRGFSMPGDRITLATPALLFSAISLLMLAFTNRFLALAALVRNLHALYKERPDEALFGQIRNLRRRLGLLRWMQVAGIASLLLCVLSMFLIYVRSLLAAEIVFGAGLVLMIVSLALSLWEIQISVEALNLHLRDIEEHEPARDGKRER